MQLSFTEFTQGLRSDLSQLHLIIFDSLTPGVVAAGTVLLPHPIAAEGEKVK